MMGIIFLIFRLLGPGISFPNEGTDLKILFTHDLHSHLDNYAGLSTLIEQEKHGLESKTLLVDAGDFSMGTLYHTIFESEAAELKMMGQMGYDAVTFGNHEFDFMPRGLATMLRNARESGEVIPALIASNTNLDPKNIQLIELETEFRKVPVMRALILMRSSIKIGIIGLIGHFATEDSPSAKPITFDYTAQNIRDLVAELKNKNGAELIIALSHSGTLLRKEDSEDEILAREVPDLDVIISGHTHSLFQEPLKIGKTLIVSSGIYGEHLGVLNLKVHPETRSAELKSYAVFENNLSVPPSNVIAKLVEKYRTRVESSYLKNLSLKFDEVLSQSDFELPKHPPEIPSNHSHETGLGNLITDAFRDAINRTDKNNPQDVLIVLEPLGMIRAGLPAGPITVAQVFEVLSLGISSDHSPGYPLISFYLTGKEIKNLLELETTVAPRHENSHLEVSGLRFRYNTKNIPLERITRLEVETSPGVFEPLNKSALYRVITNEYTAKMTGFVTRMTHGLIKLSPKTREGEPITDLDTARVDADPQTAGIQEIKEWTALAEFLKTYQIIPARYQKPEGRIESYSSWNPIEFFKKPGIFTWLVIVLVLLASASFGLLLRFLIRRFTHPSSIAKNVNPASQSKPEVSP